MYDDIQPLVKTSSWFVSDTFLEENPNCVFLISENITLMSISTKPPELIIMNIQSIQLGCFLSWPYLNNDQKATPTPPYYFYLLSIQIWMRYENIWNDLTIDNPIQYCKDKANLIRITEIMQNKKIVYATSRCRTQLKVLTKVSK